MFLVKIAYAIICGFSLIGGDDPPTPRFELVGYSKPQIPTGPTAQCDCEDCECVDCHCGYPQRNPTVTRCVNGQCFTSATTKARTVYQPAYRVQWSGSCANGQCGTVRTWRRR